MFNLLTGPRLLERVEAALPPHRERLFPPTEALAMFLAQALSADGSCQHIVNQVALKRALEIYGTDHGIGVSGRVESRHPAPVDPAYPLPPLSSGGASLAES
jgi:hypothetical protein